MDITELVHLGLTEPLAKAYITLLENGRLRPPQLAELTHETRTNAYSLLDRLVELKLVRRIDEQKKIWYEAEHPSALEGYVIRQRQEIEQRERLVKSSMSELLALYQIGNERPGVRFYEGSDGIMTIYKDQLATAESVMYVKSPTETASLTFSELHRVRNEYPKIGIHRYGIVHDRTPIDVPNGEHVPIAESDAAMLLHRTWMQEDDYTAPVEWAAYGSKLSIIQYGDEAMGMIIDSAPIADAFRQLFKMLDEGLKRRPDYASLPLKATYTATPESMKSKTD